MGQEAATVLGAALGVAIVFVPLGAVLFRRIRPWVHIMDDLVGEDARSGRKAQPGLMERMQTNEALTLVAAEQASAAKDAAWRVEDLLVSQARNLAARQRVFEENDDDLHQALAEHGITVRERRPFPPVSPNPERRSDD